MPFGEQAQGKIAGRARRQQIDAQAADNVVHAGALRQKRVQQAEQTASENRSNQAHACRRAAHAVRGVFGHHAHERARENQPFQGDIDHARPLRENAAHGGQHQRRSTEQRGGNKGSIGVCKVSEGHVRLSDLPQSA